MNGLSVIATKKPSIFKGDTWQKKVVKNMTYCGDMVEDIVRNIDIPEDLSDGLVVDGRLELSNSGIILYRILSSWYEALSKDDLGKGPDKIKAKALIQGPDGILYTLSFYPINLLGCKDQYRVIFYSELTVDSKNL